MPPLLFAFDDPVAGGTVAAGVIATLARRNLVLDPARTSLDTRDDMLGRGRDEGLDEGSLAPHAISAVTLDDLFEALGPIHLGHRCQAAAHSVWLASRRQPAPLGTLDLVAGRFAPSPSGRLHLGNLRTALAAWLAARSSGRAFYVRMEDLDPSCSSDYEAEQLSDLAALGLDWDPPVVRQSERLELYRGAIDRLQVAGMVYPCFCTRREIRQQIEESTRAPHTETPDGAYPGTCRHLSAAESGRRGRDRSPALRLRADGRVETVNDRVAGVRQASVDDVVLARADQLPAYNLAVVVDDHAQGIDQVVRADDLLFSTPRQNRLYDLFGWRHPEYWHIPLVMDGDVRLAKRTGGVTMPELVADGASPERVRTALAISLGIATSGESPSLETLIGRFGPDIINREPVQVGEIIADISR